MNHGDEDAIQMPSREEVETLCVLHAVGPSGCPVGDLAARLGLSATLAPTIAEGMQTVVRRGLLDRLDERFTWTEHGRELLLRRLTELGLR